jgi:hypothetical protein
MKKSVDRPIARRDVLQGGLLLSAGVLWGCQSKPRQAVLPGPVWPDLDTRKPTPAPTPIAVEPATPGIIDRSQWTSFQPRLSYAKPMNGVTRITVHHSAINSDGLLSKPEVARQIESIRRNHTSRRDQNTGRPWVDIGYHYIIDPAGRVWEGRPTSIEGAHVSDTNQHNIGVMLMGNFDQHPPTREALATLDAFVAAQMRRLRVPVARVYTHRELKPTECPGRTLQRYMNQTRATSGRMAAG